MPVIAISPLKKKANMDITEIAEVQDESYSEGSQSIKSFS